jgi:hypothetical protein
MQHQLEERHSYYNRITPSARVEKSVFGGGRAGRESGAEDMAGSELNPSSARLWSSYSQHDQRTRTTTQMSFSNRKREGTTRTWS